MVANCEETYSFLYTFKFQSTSFHVLTIFEIPLHTFAAYVILTKTPPKMKSVKWIMLNLHFWTALLDITLSSLTTSFILFPAVAGTSSGLLDWFGLDRALMTLFVIICIGMVIVSTIVVFENRYSFVAMSDKYWIRFRRCCIAFCYFFAVVYFLPFVYMVPDQEIAVPIVRQRLSTLSCFYTGPIYVFSLDATIPAWVTTAKLLVEVASWLYFTFLSFRCLSDQSKQIKLSRATLALQKKFLLALVLQIMIPVVVVGIPILVLAHALAQNYFNQAVNNISILVISSHGLFSTIAMLLIHEPYREFTFSCFQKKSPMRENCNDTYSFLHTFEFQSTPFHVLTIFEIPVHIFAAYVILKKTPAKMKSVKWILLNLHFWTALLDVSFSSLTTSFILFGLDRALMMLFVIIRIGSPMRENCKENYSFLYTFEFQSTSFHVLTIFEIPVHTFAAYVILTKTPSKMKSIKWMMLNLHFWTALLDVSFSFFTTSYILFPAVAGTSAGLFEWFGIEKAYMCLYIVIVVGMLIDSTMALFENRYSIISMSDDFWRRIRCGYIAMWCCITFLYFIPFVSLVPDQEYAVPIVKERLPTLSCFYDGPIYVFALDATVPGWVTAILLAIQFLSCLYFVVLTFWSLIEQTKQARLSRATLNMQKKLFFAIISQIVIPVVALVIPLAVLAHSLALNHFNQAVNNISILLISTHGLVSTIAMLLIHEPYRESVIPCARRRQRKSTNVSVGFTKVIPVNN